MKRFSHLLLAFMLIAALPGTANSLYTGEHRSEMESAMDAVMEVIREVDLGRAEKRMKEQFIDFLDVKEKMNQQAPQAGTSGKLNAPPRKVPRAN